MTTTKPEIAADDARPVAPRRRSWGPVPAGAVVIMILPVLAAYPHMPEWLQMVVAVGCIGLILWRAYRVLRVWLPRG